MVLTLRFWKTGPQWKKSSLEILRDEEIEHVLVLIKNLGKLEILSGVMNGCPSLIGSTDSNVLSRGALVSGFRLNEVKDPYPNHESVDADKLWENLKYFLSAVIPEAENAGVKLAMHPDDPPVPEVKGTQESCVALKIFKNFLTSIQVK